MARKPTTFSMRMPEDLNEKIQTYATEHNCTKAEAMSHFARAGIELEENGPASVTTSDMDQTSKEALNKIQERLETLQSLSTVEHAEPAAIVPVDIRDKIQAYSAEHSCSEHEALTYYARIGVQMTAESRPASSAELTELARRLDVLAQDNQAKTEQLKQMNELLTSIRDYTKPDELELVGELAEQDAEDVETPELTDEERQRIADEHTRQIVSDVMGAYVNQQRAEQEARDARQAAQRDTQGNPNPMVAWVPVLVAIIVSLIIGIVVIVMR